MATTKTASRPARKPPAAVPRAPRPKTPAKVAAPLAKTASNAKAAKTAKLHRKPVRDSFTMPEADFSLIATLKARALAAKRETKKSELLRAGLHALAALDAAGLMAALQQLEPVKIGRPKKGR